MPIKIKQINNEVVKPVPLIKPKDTRPVLGANLFSEIFANIFCVARKQSGKTSVIYNIIKKCANKNTTIIAFVSTLHKDNNWKTIKLFCELNNIAFVGHTSLFDGKTNILQELIDELEEANDPDVIDEPKEKNPIIIADLDDEEEDKPRKSKYQSPEYIFILDDLSDELKNPVVATLLKKNRHFLSKVIISSQYLNDLYPQSHKQIDYVLVFKGQPRKKLDEIYRNADIAVDCETFYKLYDYATKDKYNFLYIDRGNSEFRQNFNRKFELD